VCNSRAFQTQNYGIISDSVTPAPVIVILCHTLCKCYSREELNWPEKETRKHGTQHVKHSDVPVLRFGHRWASSVIFECLRLPSVIFARRRKLSGEIGCIRVSFVSSPES
jgi:hypothetical protein